jgi:hypothetical protein
MTEEAIKAYKCWGIVGLISAGAVVAGSFIANGQTH